MLTRLATAGYKRQNRESRAMILVSACLLGQPVRYDARAKTLVSDLLADWRARGLVVPFCPEVAAGLPTPRAPAEIEPGFTGDDVLDGRAKVMTQGGEDVTAAFVKGALLALQAAHTCRFALLTEASPSCGSLTLYSGRFDGMRRAGMGVTTALLTRSGIAVFSPDTITQLADRLAK